MKVADPFIFQCAILGRTTYEKAKEGELSLLSLRKEVEKLRSKVVGLEDTKLALETTCARQQTKLSSL